MPAKIENVFPTFICRGHLGDRTRRLNRELMREIAILPEIDKAGRQWSKENYAGGYSSYSSLTQLHHTSPYFAELEKLLRPYVRKFAERLNWDLLGRKLKMTTCWANSMGPSCHHTLHSHPLSVLSGVYYVYVPAQSSPFKIEDPRLPFMMNSPPRRADAPMNERNYITIKPRAGEFILFESWLRHEVPPHRGAKPRLSVSFNYEF